MKVHQPVLDGLYFLPLVINTSKGLTLSITQAPTQTFEIITTKI